ncbi:uncharacterized protein SCHCODRAFT_02569259 [Schizophyllum commune H4-8]|nr:uncharacterized protein SCHCODRAFT_02569259 [Schizophyllum commune H4-8]KAI5896557.1 hypothetical protein SCHCODRAFT_02569259 [Schizophyllum commune H4-8]
MGVYGYQQYTNAPRPLSSNAPLPSSHPPHPVHVPSQHFNLYPPSLPYGMQQTGGTTQSRLTHPYPSVASQLPFAPATEFPRAPLAFRIWEMPSLASVPPRAPGDGPYTPLINRLPPELLSQIFVEALPSQLFQAKCTRRCVPVVLSHVCEYWREVAIDTAALWQWISLTECRNKYVHRTRKLARRSVQRAKGTGLSVYFRDVEATSLDNDHFRVVALGLGVSTTPAPDRCHCALDLIMAHISEIRVLELFIGQASAQRLSAIPPNAATSLRNLRVNFVQGGDMVQSLSGLTSTSPQLRLLSWTSCFGVCAVPLPARVTYSQLVRVHLEESPMSSDAFLDMLSIGQSLQDVRACLTRSHGNASTTLARGHVVQRSVEKLFLTGDEAVDGVFNALRLPGLQDLSLNSRSDNSAEWPCVRPQSIRSFIAGTSGLRDFSLKVKGALDEVAVINILALPHAATLRRIHLTLPIFTDKFFLAMHPDHSPIPLLPHLYVMSVGKCVTTDGYYTPGAWNAAREADGNQGYITAPMPSLSTNTPLLPRPLHPGYAPLQQSKSPAAPRPPVPSVPQLNRGPMSIRIWEMPSLASIPPRAPRYGPYTPPINRLPPELLSQIFVEALPSQLFEATCSRRSVPLVLSHVCGYWREVALDTTALWQWISLTECSSRRAHHTRKLARRFVQRTKGAEVSIYFMDAEAASVQADHFKYMAMRYPVEPIPAHERCPCALDFITVLIPRVRELDLFIGHASTQRLSLLPPSSARALRNIRVDFVQGGSQVQSLCTLLSTTPKLRQFSWRNHFGICTVPAPAHVAWAQLVRAEFEKSPMTFDAFFDMLSVGQSLETVCVRLTREETSSSRFNGILVQHAVTELLLYSDGALDEIFNAIRLPSLREFTLDSGSNDSTEWPCVDTRSLRHFISGTSALQKLQFSPCGTIDEDALIVLLSLAPASTITDLSVELSLVSDRFISAMHCGQGGPLLPLLSRLSLDDCATTDGVISRMLWSRFQNQSPLVYVQIGFMRTERGRHPMDEQEFRRLTAMGLVAEGFY